jgi:hypothetical protein
VTWPAAGVIAFLLAPLAVIALDPHPATRFYTVAMFAVMAAAVAALFFTSSLQPRRGPNEPLDEGRLDRFMSWLAVTVAGTVSSVVFLFGAADLRIPVTACAAGILWSVVWLLPVMRRLGVTTKVMINCDPKSVFNFMLDERNQMRYVPDLVSVEKITDGDVGPGTRFMSKVRMDGGGIFEGVEEIVEVDWGQRIVDRVANGRRPNRGIITFAPGQPGTLMTYRFESEVSYSGALLGQGLVRFLITGAMRRRRLEILGRLKQYMESQPA